MWQTICIIRPLDYVDRLWHTGLSDDGKRCFMADVDDYYLVADTATGRVIWEDSGTGERPMLSLPDWIKDGHIDISDGPAVGRYRIIGLNYNYPLARAEQFGVELEVDLPTASLHVKEMNTGQIKQHLTFEKLSGDWAFATFSEDHSTMLFSSLIT